MKIYAITKGNYSGYHICALTVSKEKAERLNKIFTGKGMYGEEAIIEEYEDGEVEDFMFLWSYNTIDDEVNLVKDKYEDWIEWVEKYLDCDSYNVRVLARDESHARKKAHDMIARYKAEKEGIC